MAPGANTPPNPAPSLLDVFIFKSIDRYIDETIFRCFRLCVQGPCRIEMDGILNMLKITDKVNPRGFRIPNCDRKGFYRKKQVRDTCDV